jgi:hypothetical protein
VTAGRQDVLAGRRGSARLTTGVIVGLLTRYDTLAFLPAIPVQLDAWSRAISAWFDQIISNDAAKVGGFPPQYYNGMNIDPGIFRIIPIFPRRRRVFSQMAMRSTASGSHLRVANPLKTLLPVDTIMIVRHNPPRDLN